MRRLWVPSTIRNRSPRVPCPAEKRRSFANCSARNSRAQRPGTCLICRSRRRSAATRAPKDARKRRSWKPSRTAPQGARISLASSFSERHRDRRPTPTGHQGRSVRWSQSRRAGNARRSLPRTRSRNSRFPRTKRFPVTRIIVASPKALRFEKREGARRTLRRDRPPCGGWLDRAPPQRDRIRYNPSNRKYPEG